MLITSQSGHWPAEDAVLRIGALTPAGAIDLLIQLSLDTDRRSAEALAADLGRLPLALSQAGSFTRANGIDLATYLRLYQARSSELNADAQPPDYPHTVATTWQLAIGRLPPSAAALLNLLSFYASDAIPLSLLLAGVPETIDLPVAVGPQLRPLLADELTRRRAVGVLHGHSLITGAGADNVTVHRLVQAVTLDRLRALSEAGAWAEAAHSLVVAAMPPCDSVTAASLSTWNVLRAHVRKLLDILPLEQAPVLVTRRDVACWTGYAGDPAMARDLLRDLLPVCEQVLGGEHPATLATCHELAYWTGHAGDPAMARDLLRDLLPVRERALGAEHPATLTTRHDLASWTGHAGNPVAARDQVRELLTTGERALSTEHPAVLAVWSTLARLTGETGDAAAARDLFAELLPVRQRVLGLEHPRTLLVESHLAYWTGQAGNPAGARDLLAELLPVRVRILGAEHPVTLSTCHDVAVWTGRAGDAAGARDLLVELLPIRERVLGVEHPDAVETRDALDYWRAQVV
ncbi:tetratricopeptide repeat protein [Amycolatopsis sp. NBC_01480]|uniref:tetratricopeptide repeat protein n=1 Tax=Amycolatopsis sp. NBC_01480 TaxID=2903562 RepID=UPI002E2E4FDA|nr:tetratricopeptide repeat protein [Amycolatopsis sp. NBC_01480]